VEPNGSDLRHAVNGWLADFSAKPSQRSRAVKVPSKYLEDEEEDLHEAASHVSSATMGALQKQIRSSGFKGALVHGFGSGDQSGFIVTYQGQEYRFSIDEAAMKTNSALTEADKKVVRAFVAERPGSARLLDTDGVKLDKMGLGGETVAKWVGGRIAIVSTESAKSDQSIIRLIVKEAGPGVVDYSYARKGHRVHGHGAMGRNGNPKMDTFTEDFFVAALWSTNDFSDESGGEPLDQNYDISDIDESTIKGLAAECERFQEENADDLAELDSDQGQNGHDFWLTRNRHGAGFWDRGYPKDIATRLTNAAHAYGEVDLYVGDDGVIYAVGFEPKGEQTPNGIAQGKYESGSGPYTVYFETDGASYHIRRPTLKAAKIEALNQARWRGIIVSVDHKGREVWSTNAQTPNGQNGTWAHTESGRIWVPEKQFDHLPSGSTIEPLRGYGHTMAVMQDGECIGWITVDEGVARGMNTNSEDLADDPLLKLTTFGLKRRPPGAENATASCDGKVMVAYLPFLGTPYDVSRSTYSGTVELCFATLADGRRFFDQATKSGDVENAELRAGKGMRGQLVDEFDTPREYTLEPNGKGIYDETGAGKHDMVLHQDHRGSWRIDLVTSASGNHTDVTGPNRGYGSAEEAFQAALDVQRTRGIRGKSHVYIADRDGNLSDYEPMEANGITNVEAAERLRSKGYEPWKIPDHEWQALMAAEMGLSDADVAAQEVAREIAADERLAKGEAALHHARVKSRFSPNARGAALDEHAATELSLYIENDYALIGAENSKGKSIDANLRKKVAQGKYDSTLAVKLWEYLIEDGARKYAKEFSVGSDWAKTFSPATRRKVAQDFAKAWEQENQMTPNFDRAAIVSELALILRGEHSAWQGDRRTNGYRFLARIADDMPESAAALGQDIASNTADFASETGISPGTLRRASEILLGRRDGGPL
jgi:hypothetical protein